MEKVFIEAVTKAAEKLKTDLVKDAITDYNTIYKRQDLTPTETKKLAENYVNFYLSQEIYLKLSKNITKTEL